MQRVICRNYRYTVSEQPRNQTGRMARTQFALPARKALCPADCANRGALRGPLVRPLLSRESRFRPKPQRVRYIAQALIAGGRVSFRLVELDLLRLHCKALS